MLQKWEKFIWEIQMKLQGANSINMLCISQFSFNNIFAQKKSYFYNLSSVL